MAWVSWEAYLERVVLLGLARQRLSIGDASNALSRYRNCGRGRGLDQALKSLFGVDPSSLRGRSGLVWRQLNGKPAKGGDRSGEVHSFRDRRNGLVHGSRSSAPSWPGGASASSATRWSTTRSSATSRSASSSDLGRAA